MTHTNWDPFVKIWPKSFGGDADPVEEDKVPTCPHCGGKVVRVENFNKFINACDDCGKRIK